MWSNLWTAICCFIDTEGNCKSNKSESIPLREGHLTLRTGVLDSKTANNQRIRGGRQQVPAKDYGYTLARQGS